MHTSNTHIFTHLLQKAFRTFFKKLFFIKVRNRNLSYGLSIENFHEKYKHLQCKSSLNLNLGRAQFKGKYIASELLRDFVVKLCYRQAIFSVYSDAIQDNAFRWWIVPWALSGACRRRLRRYKYLRIVSATPLPPPPPPHPPPPYTPRALPNVDRHASSWLNVRSLFHFKYPSYAIDGFSANYGPPSRS